MARLHLMSVYVAVVEAEGFAGGARKLQMSPPAVTRAVAALEERLGVKLLNRTTRYVRMTEAGQKYYEDAKRIIALADEADDAVLGINAEPRGQLTVTASVLFGRLFIMPGIVEYLRRYPTVEVNALFVDRVVNMLEEGVDVAIRIGDLPDSSYRALRVGTVRRVLCASPGYLDKHGIPQVPEDLPNHNIILARGLNPANEMRFVRDSQSLTVKLQPMLSVSDNDSTASAAMAGLGITRLLNYQIAEPLQTGKLQIILSDFESPPVPVHILHREGRHSSAKIRSFVDLMAERLRAELALN
ncbi:MAG: LysR substrate-binding domain-containing protein [Methylococcaceae bacterium]|nr:LysR substrate-binding domain-containing protein [Methylococcaceae bacterium]MDP2394324.1 LysR substrate-binding domain-containing protein [Methylococcaceae bacterium]MDP3020113.1 LysR substrate-binding domain-containing protein [Methylococcaceae bacterium]MDP3391187.1 LysR substrate-binding domain-containing protein [Methylococcaceae bacterium]MDP3932557.1 LysR substrate-binding domain-containing protein [Methylococcaceae bacterium]